MCPDSNIGQDMDRKSNKGQCKTGMCTTWFKGLMGYQMDELRIHIWPVTDEHF